MDRNEMQRRQRKPPGNIINNKALNGMPHTTEHSGPKTLSRIVFVE